MSRAAHCGPPARVRPWLRVADHRPDLDPRAPDPRGPASEMDLVGVLGLPELLRQAQGLCLRRDPLLGHVPLDSESDPECPQRDSNPCYGLERAATWTASRWGRRGSEYALQGYRKTPKPDKRVAGVVPVGAGRLGKTVGPARRSRWSLVGARRVLTVCSPAVAIFHSKSLCALPPSVPTCGTDGGCGRVWQRPPRYAKPNRGPDAGGHPLLLSCAFECASRAGLGPIRATGGRADCRPVEWPASRCQPQGASCLAVSATG